ncbi:MAG: hypothetical protein K2X50_03645 [Gammaproteobacteria bacterium]|nr:hypothetical protein [Gammaproteobacteria bacterium]
MNKHHLSMFKSFTLSLLLVSLSWSINAYALGLFDPTSLGAYKVGHTTLLVKDPSRNPNGSTTGTPVGRELFLHIWYPTTSQSGPLTQYTLNNPIYDGTHSGYSLLHFSAVYPSNNSTREGVPVANGPFPLLIYSHGSASSSITGNRDLSETLASHGYIVVGIEHTGSNFNLAINRMLGLPDTPLSSGVGRTIGRSKDVRFVITAMQNPAIAPQFASRINPNQIGLFGYSLGGFTTMVTVAGQQSASPALLPDSRIKAAVAMDGSDPGSFTAADFANVTVPVMLYQDADVNANLNNNVSIFPQLINSNPKYYVDIAGLLHPSGSGDNLCERIHTNLLAADQNPGNLNDYASVYFSFGIASVDIFADCDQTIFNGVSQQLQNNIVNDLLVGTFENSLASTTNAGTLINIGDMKQLMPLRPAVPYTEISRMQKWYIVSFFNKILKGQQIYSLYLTDSPLAQVFNPLAKVAANCQAQPDHLVDIQNGNKLSFNPTKDGHFYQISFSKGNTLLDKGTDRLNWDDVSSDDTMQSITLPFSFPVPNVGLINNITLFANGVIMATPPGALDLTGATTLTPFYSTGAYSPWAMSGEILLNGLPTIAGLWADLSPQNAPAGHGVFKKVLADRIVITFDQVPMCCSIGIPPNTFQVVIYKTGKIEIIYGDMSGVGTEYDPNWLGGIGVATGQSSAYELRIDNVDFTKLTKPVILPSAYEIFYLGNGVSSCSTNN